jgi:putative oxidoreductase
MEEERKPRRAMKIVFPYIYKVVKSPYLSLILRLYIGSIFIYAGMSKVHYPGEFAENLAAYQMLPYWAVNFVAVILPWVEIICGLFLIIGLKSRVSASIIGVLLIVFTFGIFINLLKGTPISCGCFDSIGAEISWKDVFRDLGWFILTLQIFFNDQISLIRRGQLLLRK